jgi:hypothetical protein
MGKRDFKIGDSESENGLNEVVVSFRMTKRGFEKLEALSVKRNTKPRSLIRDVLERYVEAEEFQRQLADPGYLNEKIEVLTRMQRQSGERLGAIEKVLDATKVDVESSKKEILAFIQFSLIEIMYRLLHVGDMVFLILCSLFGIRSFPNLDSYKLSLKENLRIGVVEIMNRISKKEGIEQRAIKENWREEVEKRRKSDGLNPGSQAKSERSEGRGQPTAEEMSDIPF